MKTLVVIIARGNSKGIANKNLQLIQGVPLLLYSYRAVKAIQPLHNLDIILSTDSDTIRNVFLDDGGWAPFIRPPHLALDNVPSYPVVMHALQEAERINGFSYDSILYLQPTCPLVRSEDISQALHVLETSPSSQSVVAITPVSTHPFRMKRLLPSGVLVNYIDQGFEDMRPRQALPPVYRRAGSIYLSRRTVLFDEKSLVSSNCLGLEVPPDTAVDIDSSLDLALVNTLLSSNS